MKKRKTISGLPVSPAFPEPGKSLVPKAHFVIISKNTLKPHRDKRSLHAFHRKRSVIKQP